MKVFSEPGVLSRSNDFSQRRLRPLGGCFTTSPAWDIITTMRGIIFSTAATSPIWRATRISF